MKIGNRVAVLPLPDDDPRKRHEGKRGEVEQIASDGRVLVDDQLHDGERRGPITMREWFVESELEVG
jgi:hypothetical protein